MNPWNALAFTNHVEVNENTRKCLLFQDKFIHVYIKTDNLLKRTIAITDIRSGEPKLTM